MIRARLLLVLVLAGLTVSWRATPTFASGAAVQHDVVQTQYAVPTCAEGNPVYDVTFYWHVIVTHDSTNSAGGATTSAHVTGTAVLTPTYDQSLPTYTGHIGEHDVSNVTPGGTTTMTVTENQRARGSDGSVAQLHLLIHETINPDGTITSSTYVLNCGVTP